MYSDDDAKSSFLWRLYQSFHDRGRQPASPQEEAQEEAQAPRSPRQERLALHGLLTQRWQNEAEYRSFCDILHLEATDVRRYVVLDVAMDGYESLFLRYSLDGIQQIREELLAQCEQALGGVTGVFVEDNLIGLLLSRTGFLLTEELVGALDQLRSWTQTAYGLNLTVGIGTYAMDASGLPESQRNARIATKYRMIFGSGQNIEYESIRMRVGVSIPYPEELEKDILEAIRRGDSARFERKLNDFYEVVCSASYQMINLSSATLLAGMYRRLEPGMQGRCDVTGVYTQLQSCGYWADQMRLLRAFGLSVMPQEQEKMSSRSDEYAQRAMAYIHTNYPNPDLSLVSIAEHVGVSQNTIRLVMHEKTGMAPRDYILQVRMEEACRLLRETELTAREISERVGYKESRYFYNVFKRYTGATAFEYRTRARRQ
ncbi:MAG: helix-turn-helix transcriptional regulator [Aristaeellaceae bacterium]